MMIRTVHAKMLYISRFLRLKLTKPSDCASTCSRIYSRALESASSLHPLNYRVSIEEKLDPETNGYALRPVDYRNWFFDGQPSPLQLGMGTITLTRQEAANAAVSDEKPHAVPRFIDLVECALFLGRESTLDRATSRAGK